VSGVIDDHTRLALLRAAQHRERGHGLGDPAPRSGLDGRAGVRPGAGGDVRQRQVLLGQLRVPRGPPRSSAARQILIPPYTPRWNRKIERFFGTLDTQWAHGRVWLNRTQRDRALSSFIRFYNRRRLHLAAGGRPPISRVH
jgi:transposase InsO family protein